MNWKGLITGSVSFLSAVLWTGCGTHGLHSAVVCQSDEVRSGDTISITFLDTADPAALKDAEFQIRSDGTINMPTIGQVTVAGKKFGEIEAELHKRYVPRVYTRLTVVVKPKERFFTVDGEVKGAGRQLYFGETTVLRAIAGAGGFNEFANRRKVRVLRANGAVEAVDCRKAERDPKFDRPICPGDAIIVPRSL